MEISAIHVINSDQKNQIPVNFGYNSLSFEHKNHLYSSLRFEIGGNNDSILFIHITDTELIYIPLDRNIKKQLLEIEVLKAKLLVLFKVSDKTFYSDLKYIGLFLVFIASLVYYRAPIAGAFATLIPVSVEKKIGDKIFKTEQADEFKSVAEAEKKLQALLVHIKDYDENKFTVHISSKKELNAYATIGGHLFINKGLIDDLKTPEELLGVIGHEMIHAEKRHVIKSLFQGAGLFLLIQTLLGDVTGLAAVLADNSGSLLQLSYSRDLESEADLLAVKMMLDSQINPTGLKSALEIIEANYKKIMSEMAGGGAIDKIMNQNFLRSHPQTEQRCLDIQNQIDELRKTPKYEHVEYINLESQWADFKVAMKEL
jgi:Zn-dependent protease with chaperone function